MENIRKILLLTSCLFITLGTYAQSINVTGKVIDEEGLEVIGANISVKGSAGVGTITDLNGQYTLKVNNPSKDILVFSFIGMRTQEVHVKGKKRIDVTLQSDSKLLDEVVVIGYGQQKKESVVVRYIQAQRPYRFRRIGKKRGFDANSHFRRGASSGRTCGGCTNLTK